MTPWPDDSSLEDAPTRSANVPGAEPNEPHDADGETAAPDLAGGEVAEVISVEPADPPAPAAADDGAADPATAEALAGVEVLDEQALLAEGAEDVDEFAAVVESPYDRPGQWFVVHT